MLVTPESFLAIFSQSPAELACCSIQPSSSAGAANNMVGSSSGIALAQSPNALRNAIESIPSTRTTLSRDFSPRTTQPNLDLRVVGLLSPGPTHKYGQQRSRSRNRN